MNEQRFCTSCGQPVAGMRFCTNCGVPVVPAPPVTAPPASGPPASGPPTAPPTFVESAPEPGPAAWTQVRRSEEAPQLAPDPVPAADAYWSSYANGYSEPSSPSYAGPQPDSYAAPQPPRRPKRDGSTKVAWVLGGAALVLVVGGGAFALGSLHDRGDHHAGVTPPTKAAGSTSADPHTQNASGQPSPSATTIDPNSPEGVARSVSSLISDSQVDKSEIGQAASNLSSCRSVSAGVQTFDKAMTSRRQLVKEARNVDVSGLAGGQTVIDELSQAWDISAQADSAYAQWGRSVHRARGRCVSNSAALKRATDLSDRSHPHKQAAAKAWNPIARRYGLPTVTWDQL